MPSAGPKQTPKSMPGATAIQEGQGQAVTMGRVLRPHVRLRILLDEVDALPRLPAGVGVGSQGGGAAVGAALIESVAAGADSAVSDGPAWMRCHPQT